MTKSEKYVIKRVNLLQPINFYFKKRFHYIVNVVRIIDLVVSIIFIIIIIN